MTNVRLLHLSDLHFPSAGGHEGRAALSSLIAGFDQQPDIAVVSGDLVSVPSASSYSACTTFLHEQFPSTRVICCPGNHDVSWGSGRLASFERAFPQWRSPYTDHLKELAVLPIDSTISSDAGGGVSLEELTRVGEIITAWGAHFRNRVALLHHHVLPAVPLMDMPWDESHHAMGAAQNSHHLLHLLQKHRFCAVLHGHGHIPSEASVATGFGATSYLRIIGCGSSLMTGLVRTATAVLLDLQAGEIRAVQWYLRSEGAAHFQPFGGPPNVTEIDESAGGSPPTIFLCHASEDREYARWLHDRLSSAGLNPWLDQEKLKVGDDWRAEIRRAIEVADFFVPILSANSVRKRRFINNELRQAVAAYRERPFGSAYILPVKREPCNVPPIHLDETRQLSDIQWMGDP